MLPADWADPPLDIGEGALCQTGWGAAVVWAVVVAVVTMMGDAIGEVLISFGTGASRSRAVWWVDWIDAEVLVGDVDRVLSCVRVSVFVCGSVSTNASSSAAAGGFMS